MKTYDEMVRSLASICVKQMFDDGMAGGHGRCGDTTSAILLLSTLYNIEPNVITDDLEYYIAEINKRLESNWELAIEGKFEF